MNRTDCLPEVKLTLYCTGDLPPVEVRTIREHLATCLDCRREAAAIEKTLSGLPRVDLSLSEAEKRRFADRATQLAERPERSGRLQAWGAAATTVIAGLVAVWVFSPEQLPIREPVPTNPRLAEFDLVENLEILEEMELLEAMDILEQLEDRG